MNFKAGWHYILYEDVIAKVVDLYNFETKRDMDIELEELNRIYPDTKFIVARVVLGELTHTDDDSRVIIS